MKDSLGNVNVGFESFYVKRLAENMIQLIYR